MGKLKEFYHEEIERAQREANSDKEFDELYEQYIQELAKEDQEYFLDKQIMENAEQAAFFNIFDLTHTYPM